MQFHYLDVFTTERYCGNPLAVFVDSGRLTDDERQRIAREVGFSETTFVRPEPVEEGSWKVRIFSPDKELPFAGHPTLGTAAVIAKFLNPGAQRLSLSLPVGTISVTRDGELWEMEQMPAAVGLPVLERSRAAGLVGLTEADLDPELPVQIASTGLSCFVIPLRSLETLNQCRVDHRAYELWLRDYGAGNLAFFARGSVDPSCSVSVRVFVDDAGYYEDPATGSAAGILCGYFLHHKVFGPDSIDLWESQGDQMGRPSRLRLRAWIENGVTRVRVAGSAIFVASGIWPEVG